MNDSPFFSVIIPVYNGGKNFLLCLQSVYASSFRDWELLVVDDGSTDGSPRLARQFGARVLFTAGRAGPAAARNQAAAQARGRYLFFTDADCALHPDTLAQAAAILQGDPSLEALFGSYDDAPSAAGFVARYKNLFHHYVHQRSSERATTFWTACGAVRRTTFLRLGGFDAARYRRPSIEDIDFGYRLTQAGGRIRLAKSVQVKHLKAWTLPGLLRSDIFDRGLPWTRLLLRRRVFTADLNLQTHNRVSVAAVYLLALAVLLSPWYPAVLCPAVGLVALLLWLNRDLYAFFRRRQGTWFALRAVPLHWLYYLYNGLSFVLGVLAYLFDLLAARRPSAARGRQKGAARDP